MTTHAKRLMTGIVLGLALGAVIFWASDMVLRVVVLGVSALGMWEFTSLFWHGRKNLRLKVLGLALCAGVVLHPQIGLSADLAVVAAFFAASLVYLFSFSSNSRVAFPDIQVVCLGVIYLPLVLQLFLSLGRVEIVFVLVTAFASDTGAFYSGSMWGGKKLWPQISPKKSWAGSWGGMACAVLASLALGLGFGQAAWYHWLWVGVLVNLGAQFGDLFESALKRQLQVKDSGAMLPGHGGLLDRIDSLLLALPVYMLITSYVALFVR